LSWNSYIKAQIAASDYEGIVTLWDASTGVAVMQFEEHEKRAWSVDFCRVDPTRLASGSDEGKVKIWSTTQSQSVATIESKANICCVKFNPENSNYVAFGSAGKLVENLPNNLYYVFLFFSFPCWIRIPTKVELTLGFTLN
jgi:E3 ubiquitin-protein ligase RFWD2